MKKEGGAGSAGGKSVRTEAKAGVKPAGKAPVSKAPAFVPQKGAVAPNGMRFK
jgi:hypothetical protein